MWRRQTCIRRPRRAAKRGARRQRRLTVDRASSDHHSQSSWRKFAMPELQHIHPVLVHFPIVLMYALVVIDLAALANRNAVTTRSGVGTISTFAAVAAGLFAVGTWF